jgi:hypothetical protein
MDNTNEHIKDDFLKGLINLSEDEKVSVDFTQKVMAAIPKPVVVKEEKSSLKPWQWIVVAAASIGIIYFVITFDLSTLLRQITTVSDDGGASYLSMFTSLIQLFSKAFSGFQFTSITLMIVISGVALYLGDKFLRKWSKTRTVTVMI